MASIWLSNRLIVIVSSATIISNIIIMISVVRIRELRGGGEILVVVTQCLLLPTGTHHSYTTHTVSLRGGRGGGS